MKDKIFLRGKVSEFQFGTRVSLHKDVIQHFKGDYLNFNIKQNREGKMYLELDTWEPKKQGQIAIDDKRIIRTESDLPAPDFDEGLPF